MFTKVGAILLTAGTSRRMGKQLLPVSGESAVFRCTRTLLESGIDDVIVVVGHDRWRIGAELATLPVCLAVNEVAHSETAVSVRIGITVMPGYITGVMVAMSDQPPVLPETCRTLLDVHAMNPDRILLPVYKGMGGHPTLFPMSMCGPVVQSGVPLKEILKRNPVRITRIPVDDPGVIHDMDTPPDYNRVVNLAGDLTAAT